MFIVEDWYHVKPSDLVVEDIVPTRLNQNRNRVQQPWFNVFLPNREAILISEKPMIWGLLDALFPDDPLPRQPVNEMMIHQSHEFVHDLNAFFQESETPIISFYAPKDHGIDDPSIKTQRPWDGRAAVAITSSAGPKAPDCVEIEEIIAKNTGFHGQIVSAYWKDSAGKHLLPSVLTEVPGCGYIHAIDLGKKIVIGSLCINERGEIARPLRIESIEKKRGWLNDRLVPAAFRHGQALVELEGQERAYPPWSTDPINTSSSEVAEADYQRFLRSIIV